ncbi:MAG: DMT family transporter [Bacteroidales bacterium]|nr:DMT family transporter [Bacteroidales bacterium]
MSGGNRLASNKKAYFFALVSVLFWSTAGSAFKLTLFYLHPHQLLFLASFFSFLALFILYAFTNKFKINELAQPIHLARSAFLGFLNPFLYYVVLFRAYSLLPAQEAVALNYLWPVALVLLSIPLLKQKLSWISLLAILISFSGTIVIAMRGDFSSFVLSDPLGVSLAVGSSLVWALYWIFNMKDTREALGKLVLNFTFGTLYITILIVFTSPTLSFEWQGFAGAGYIGLFEMGFTFFFWLLALKYSDTTARISNLIFLSPFLSLIFIRIIVKETIMLSTVIGLVLIITGVLMQHYFSEKVAVQKS